MLTPLEFFWSRPWLSGCNNNIFCHCEFNQPNHSEKSQSLGMTKLRPSKLHTGMVFLRKVEELMTRALSGLCLNASFGFPQQVRVGNGRCPLSPLKFWLNVRLGHAILRLFGQT